MYYAAQVLFNLCKGNWTWEIFVLLYIYMHICIYYYWQCKACCFQFDPIQCVVVNRLTASSRWRQNIISLFKLLMFFFFKKKTQSLYISITPTAATRMNSGSLRKREWLQWGAAEVPANATGSMWTHFMSHIQYEHVQYTVCTMSLSWISYI